MTKPQLCRDALKLLLEEKELSASNQSSHCLSHGFLGLPHHRLTGSGPRSADPPSLCTSRATGQGLTDGGTEAQGCQTKGLAEADEQGTCPLPGLQTSEPGNCRGPGSFPTTWWLLAGFPRVSGHEAEVVGPSMRHQGQAGSHGVTSLGGATLSNWWYTYVSPLQGILCSSSWLDFTLPQRGLGQWQGDPAGSLCPSSPSC